jgi:hypothetical protein
MIAAGLSPAFGPTKISIDAGTKTDRVGRIGLMNYSTALIRASFGTDGYPRSIRKSLQITALRFIGAFGETAMGITGS